MMEAGDTPKMLPCPFCGDSTELKTYEDLTGRREIYVICGMCAAQGPPPGERCNEADAIAEWNKRPRSERIAKLEAEWDDEKTRAGLYRDTLWKIACMINHHELYPKFTTSLIGYCDDSEGWQAMLDEKREGK